MERVIDRLSDHYIVCGYGRMGAQSGDMLILVASASCWQELQNM
jgi:voltage-gated potassium channel Kch